MFKINLSKISVSSLKKYTSFIIVFALLVVVVGGYFLWLPNYQTFQANNKDLGSEGEKISKKKEYLYELEGHLNNLEEYQEDMAKIDSALPFEYSPASLYSFIQKTGAESGMVVSQAEFSKTASSSKAVEKDTSSSLTMNSIDISVTLEGDYLSFKKFLSIIFKTSRLIEIKSLSFESAPKDNPEETIDNYLNFQLELSCNYYQEKQIEEGLEPTAP